MIPTNITQVKFFQPVNVPTGNNSSSPMTYANSATLDIEIQGNFLKLTHRNTGGTVYATLHNVCYIRTDNESITETTPSVKKTNKQKPV